MLKESAHIINKGILNSIEKHKLTSRTPPIRFTIPVNQVVSSNYAGGQDFLCFMMTYKGLKILLGARGISINGQPRAASTRIEIDTDLFKRLKVDELSGAWAAKNKGPIPKVVSIERKRRCTAEEQEDMEKSILEQSFEINEMNILLVQKENEILDFKSKLREQRLSYESKLSRKNEYIRTLISDRNESISSIQVKSDEKTKEAEDATNDLLHTIKMKHRMESINKNKEIAVHKMLIRITPLSRKD